MSDLKLHARAPLDGLVEPGRFGAVMMKPGLIIEQRTDLALATLIARRGEMQNLRRAITAEFGLAGRALRPLACVASCGSAPRAGATNRPGRFREIQL